MRRSLIGRRRQVRLSTTGDGEEAGEILYTAAVQGAGDPRNAVAVAVAKVDGDRNCFRGMAEGCGDAIGGHGINHGCRLSGNQPVRSEDMAVDAAAVTLLQFHVRVSFVRACLRDLQVNFQVGRP